VEYLDSSHFHKHKGRAISLLGIQKSKFLCSVELIIARNIEALAGAVAIGRSSNLS
jgi:hypothetical protein